MLVKVKNLNGIDKNQFLPEEISWKEWWEKKQGRTLPAKCSRDACNQVAIDVFPVQKADGETSWYMVPLCKSCGERKLHDEFEVKADDLQLIDIK